MHIINMEGEIGWDVTVEGVREELKKAGGDNVLVMIASPGGYISEGLKIYNALKNYDGVVDTCLAGFVASMGTYISMVGIKRTAEENAIFMIHNASMGVWGDHFQMFKAGKHLDSVSNIAAKEYSAKSGTSLIDIRSAMNRETFYYGDEIQAAGFVHEMVETDDGPQNKDESIAVAKLMFEASNAKMNSPENIEKDMTALCTMMKLPKKENTGNGPDIKPKQEKIMDLEQLKKDHPDLYAKIVQIGEAKGEESGVTKERLRVKSIVAFRGKFPKLHAVVDSAISEGHDLTEFNLNIMSAHGTAEELDKKIDESKNHKSGSESEDDTPEMKDGVMAHDDHVDELSKKLAALPGM